MAQRILVGYDGSPEAELAIEWAAEAAMSRKAALEIITAWTLPPTEVGMGAGPAYETQLLDELKSESDISLAKGIARAKELAPDVDVTGHVLAGSAGASLVEEAENADMIVLGSHGRKGLAGIILGSVSRQVATHAQCPAVVVREAADPNSKRLVVGVDGSQASVNAVDFAFEVAGRRGYTIHVLHAWEIPPIGAVSGVPVFSPPDLIEDLGQESMRALAQQLAGKKEDHPGIEVTTEVIQGSPSKALQEASAHAAMVVVGSRGRGGFRGLLLGSVGNSVIARATCPVAIVR